MLPTRYNDVISAAVIPLMILCLHVDLTETTRARKGGEGDVYEWMDKHYFRRYIASRRLNKKRVSHSSAATSDDEIG